MSRGFCVRSQVKDVTAQREAIDEGLRVPHLHVHNDRAGNPTMQTRTLLQVLHVQPSAHERALPVLSVPNRHLGAQGRQESADRQPGTLALHSETVSR